MKTVLENTNPLANYSGNVTLTVGSGGSVGILIDRSDVGGCYVEVNPAELAEAARFYEQQAYGTDLGHEEIVLERERLYWQPEQEFTQEQLERMEEALILTSELTQDNKDQEEEW